MSTLTIRKLADKTAQQRVTRFDPVTGEKKLVNPNTPGDDHEPWPLLGVQIVGEAPTRARLSTTLVAQGVAEGWLTGVGGSPVVRPAGRTPTEWNSTHTRAPHIFMHYDELVIKTIDGQHVRYRVTHQPDKYVADGTDDAEVTAEHYAAGNTRVDHFYDVELVR